MSNPICLNCHITFTMSNLGSRIEEQLIGTDGTITSYKLWHCDVWVCTTCDSTIAIRAQEPFMEHWQEAYNKYADEATNRFYGWEEND